MKEKLKYVSMLHLGILLLAVGIYFFKFPNGFATGGVSGLAVILSNVFPIAISKATYMLVINALLLIIGVIVLGKECGLLTVYCSLMLSLLDMLFDFIVPLDAPLTSYPILELVYAVLLTGIGSAMIFKCRASSGGTDIVALILKKYTQMNVGTALLCTDILIAAATFIGFGKDDVTLEIQTGLFSLLGLFAKVFVVDDIIDSLNLCKAFTIITTKPDQINQYILEKMHHSATTYSATGAYTSENRSVIMTVCRRSEAIKLRRVVSEIDPGAFLIITKTSEILGKGFRDNLN